MEHKTLGDIQYAAAHIEQPLPILRWYPDEQGRPRLEQQWMDERGNRIWRIVEVQPGSIPTGQWF